MIPSSIRFRVTAFSVSAAMPYRRFVKTSAGKMALRILRLRCTECGHTHAVILSSIVPYSQTPLNDQRQIIVAYETGRDRNCSINENNVKYIIHNYRRHWRERLCSERISLLITANISQAKTHFKIAMKIYEDVWADEPELIEAKYQEIQELYPQVGIALARGILASKNK